MKKHEETKGLLNKNISTDSIFDYLAKIKKKIECLISIDNNSFIAIMEDFWDFIISIDKDKIVDKLEDNSHYLEYKIFFAEKWHIYISLIERIKTESFLSNNCEVLNDSKSILSKEDYIGVEKELALAGDSFNGCSIAMIGCGPFPETLMEIYKYNPTVKMAIGIDNREDVVKISNNIIKRIFPQSLNIKTIVSDATHFNYSSIDVIFLANGLIGKDNILKQIYRTASVNTKVLVRNPILMGKILYEDIYELSQFPKFNVLKSVQSSKLGKTLLMSIKDGL
ncbi:MAG: hypothetical protein ABIF22_02810 [bacterium]